mmetsp:Transcript_1343/g.4006  ORF Transcript_1343/g.4006 Transcript_1343/m.4006 type:complete len:235 (-) Transcript_1343:1083-1787(-)
MLPINLTAAEGFKSIEASGAHTSLGSRYNEPWRSYHTWRHPMKMKALLLQAEAEGVPIVDGAAAAAFVLWHDAVYDPQAAHGRNEELSQQLCQLEFGALAGKSLSVTRACEAILATIGHELPSDHSRSPDAALLLDIDLSILGAPDAEFKGYDQAIRQEYRHVPEEVYREKRAAVLEAFLRRHRLFLTEWGYGRWEAPARANLAHAIAELRQPHSTNELGDLNPTSKRGNENMM